MDEKLFNDEYRQLILTRVKYKINNHQDSEDICQEILTAAWDALRKEKINNPGKIRAYVKQIYLNKIANYFRKKRIKNNSEIEFQENELNIYNPDHNVLDRIISDEEKKRIDEALQGLKTQHRKIMILRYYDGWDYNKIAQVLDLSCENVRKLASRCRVKLKKY